MSGTGPVSERLPMGLRVRLPPSTACSCGALAIPMLLRRDGSDGRLFGAVQPGRSCPSRERLAKMSGQPDGMGV
jgi:hypothetical protein